MKLKLEAITKLNLFRTYMEKQFGGSIKATQADMGGEYKSIEHYAQQYGIHIIYSCSYTHYQNGIA